MASLLLNPLVTSSSPAVTQTLSNVQRSWPLCPLTLPLHLEHFLLNGVTFRGLRWPHWLCPLGVLA